LPGKKAKASSNPAVNFTKSLATQGICGVEVVASPQMADEYDVLNWYCLPDD
jgi:hypothetical protein